jgi:hypothetical protein
VFPWIARSSSLKNVAIYAGSTSALRTMAEGVLGSLPSRPTKDRPRFPLLWQASGLPILPAHPGRVSRTTKDRLLENEQPHKQLSDQRSSCLCSRKPMN